MNVNISDEDMEYYVMLKYLKSSFTGKLILFVLLEKAKSITHFI